LKPTPAGLEGSSLGCEKKPSHTSMPAMPFLKTLVEMKDVATLGSGLHPKSSNEQKENEKMCENYI